ncbi:MAG: hypothetical protein AB2693_35350 [Candidatus Thiodiazotropha sp.]
MAAGYDDSEMLHLLNGTDFREELKTFTELKPVRLPFQEEFHSTTQDFYDDDHMHHYASQNSCNYDDQNQCEWLKDDSNSTGQEPIAEQIDLIDQSVSESQPICNQEFFSKLDDTLLNLPRELYIERLVELSNNCEETISMYRNILVKRARLSEKCPNGHLSSRRSTKLETSSKRYANDCYALQSFIDNEDPKVLSETIVKKRTTIKSEPSDSNTPVIGMSSMKIEIAELKAQVLELKGTINVMKSEQTNNKASISALEKCVRDLSSDLSMTKQLLEKHTESANKVQNSNPQTPSLFENLRRQKQNEAQQQLKTDISNKVSASSIDLNTKSNTETSQNHIQVLNGEVSTKNKATVQDKDNQTHIQNSRDTNTFTSENKINDSASTNSAVSDTKASSNKFDGNYVAALKSNLEQNGTENTSSRGTSNLSETRHIGNRDLYMYYNEDGLPRFGRSKQNVPVSDPVSGTNDDASPYEQIHQSAIDESESEYPYERIEVRTTNRYEQHNYKNRNENKVRMQQQRQTIKEYTNLRPSDNNNENISQKATKTNAKNLYTSNETPVFSHMDSEEPIFEGIVRRRTVRYYIGNIGQKSNRLGLIKFLNDYGIEPVGVRIIETYRGHLSAKITVFASDSSIVESCITWPKKMYCRRWQGVQQWNARSDYTSNNYYEDNYYHENETGGVD